MQVSIVRLAPSAHGEGDHAFVPFRIAKAREKGFSADIDDGSNRWSAVHRRDAAVVFRLALEAGPAHATYHGNAEEGITFRDIATAVGQGLHLPVESVPPEAADDHFDWLSGFVALDCPASSASTQERLGWRPGHVGLLGDRAAGHYFEA